MLIHREMKVGLRYAVVGGICAAVHNLMMIGGDYSGYNYARVAFISFLIVTPLAYSLHCTFTFGESLSFKGLMRYAAVAAAGFAAYFVLLAILCSGLGMRAALATPILTLVFVIWNYISTHWAIRRNIRLMFSESSSRL
jgi:putative flippase GtrA